VKVVISVGGRFHAIRLAEQLYQAGLLERIITTKRWYVKRIFPARYYTSIPVPDYIGMLIRRIPALVKRGYYSFIKDNLFDALARRYIPPCDIFHAWGNYALISMPYARKFGAKVVIERGSSHPKYQDDILREECEQFGVMVERAHPQIIEKGLKEIELADHVIIPSEFVRRSFLANGFPESKLSVIPYGIDLSGFYREQKGDDVFRVLFVGNIGVQKGVHYLLEAWKQLALPNAELVFIGSVEPGMQAMLDKYKGLYTLTGHVPHEALRAWYGNASVFILPSLQEGSALVTYEAMACGLPSIVSVNTGSIVRDGIDGYVIPIRDVDAIKEKLLLLYDDPRRCIDMGNNAMTFVQDFTWERYAKNVIAVYRRLLAQGPDAP
jgi:glycosyltransferase involved in cell wall biosynthesis